MKAKILVVDDEEITRRSLADILRLEGYQVQVASGGEIAVEALKRDQFDLILLDLKMPGMDGLEVLKNAAKISPETMVILLTAHGSLESAIEALRQSAYDYLLKPSSPQQILKSVSGALAKRAEAQHKRLLIEKLDSSLKELREVEKRETDRPPEQTVISLANNITIDLARREIWQSQPQGDVKMVTLTATEGKLLKVLFGNLNHVLSHRELVLLVQGYDVTDWEAPEVLRPLVSRLRQKLARVPGGEKWISNVRGTGYVLEVDIENPYKVGEVAGSKRR